MAESRDHGKEKYLVTIKVDLPAYAEIEVLATSQEEAEATVRADIAKKGFNSEYYLNNDSAWMDEWSGATNLRVED